jgi:hypothetical protein
MNLRILVCRHCLDEINSQLRTIVLPADPTPIMNARVENFEMDESDYRTVSAATVVDPVTGIPIPSTNLRTTEDCQNRVVEPYGAPVGLTQAAQMPYNGAIQQAFGQPLEILSVTSNGTATVQVTCSKVHGLQNNSQVSVQGLKNPDADGFFSVSVLGATSFTYMCYGSIAADSLLEPATRIVTALVGLPRGFVQIPQVKGPSATPIATADELVELEDDDGFIQLEDSSGDVELESGP